MTFNLSHDPKTGDYVFRVPVEFFKRISVSLETDISRFIAEKYFEENSLELKKNINPEKILEITRGMVARKLIEDSPELSKLLNQ